MPPFLPAPLALVYISGVFEVMGGLGILLGATRQWACRGLLALLLAVFPANIYVAQQNIGLGGPETGNLLLNWLRLPFQALFVAWAWWYTRD